MRGHSHEVDENASLRPKADRVEQPENDLAYQAAAAGRPDVLGPAGMLGLQRVVGNAGTATLAGEAEEQSSVHEVVGRSGSPLDSDTRTDMESRFGQDFSHVRVHTDSTANQSAKSLNAQAYTVGSDIVFGAGNYNPSSDSGKHMLAHELTHVVQQGSGPVEGTDMGGGVSVSDPSDRFEREASANADHIMSSPAPAAGSAVQRQSEEGSTDVQRSAEAGVAQREEMPVEEEEAMAQTYVQRQEEELDEEMA